MAAQYLSMLDPPPEGFVFKKELQTRDFRRGVFALAAPTVEIAEHFLSPVIGKISGLIVTLGPCHGWEPRAPGLYHLMVPRELMPFVSWILPPLLSLIEGESDAREAKRVCALDLERMTDDVKRLANQLFDTSRLLSSELAVRRDVEKTLEENRKWLRTIYDSVNDAVFVHDAQTGRILDVNQRMCDLYGYTRAEVLDLGSSCLHSGVAPYDQKGALGRVRQAASGTPLTFEWQSRHRSGRVFWVEVSSRAATLVGRDCVLATVRDITERKEAEEHRRRIEAELLQAQKRESLGVLAGGIAHDFNNLLMTILGNADLTLAELPSVSPVRDNINEIISASRRAADLCSQMLAYAGKGKLISRPINLNDVISGMRSMLESAVPKIVSLRFELVQDLPPVVADTAQLQQVLMNLVNNAAEAIGHVEGVVSISTGLRHCDRASFQSAIEGAECPEGDYVFLEVRDTGSGIKPEAVSRIFEPFYTTKSQGRGLGLPAVQGIVGSHKGAMQFHSEEGKGTVFTILLPTVGEGTQSPSRAASRETVRAGAVLVVDDDESIRVMTSKMLKAMGYDAIAVSDGEQALQLIKTGKKLACVLLDLNMPVLSGEETYREIRKMDPGLPVIISSGYGDLEISEAFSGDAAFGVIQKPYQMSALRLKLEETLMTAGTKSGGGRA